jgi:hypothetical protein
MMRWILAMTLAGLALGCGGMEEPQTEQTAQGLQSPAEVMRCGIPGVRAIQAAAQTPRFDFEAHQDVIDRLAPAHVFVLPQNREQRFDHARLDVSDGTLFIDVQVTDIDYFDIVDNTLVLTDADTGADLATFPLHGRCGFLSVYDQLPLAEDAPERVQLEWLMHTQDGTVDRRLRRVVEL